MYSLFLADSWSMLCSVLVAGMIVFMAVVMHRRKQIAHWGRLVAAFILFGTVISGLAAVRDGYGTDNALFSMTSVQSNLCSLAGGTIFLVGLCSLFWKRQIVRRFSFFLISIAFAVQVLTIEISRLVQVVGGAL